MDALLKGITLDYLAACDPAKTGKTWQAFLPKASLVPAARRMYAADYHLEDIFALDCAEGFVVTYHFAHFEKPGRVALRVVVPQDAPTLPSIAAIFQGAEWHERETRDFHGVQFEGNPNFIPLLISPDMADCFPLRKEPKNRAKMRDVLEAGTVLFQNPSFSLMSPDAPAEGQDKGAAKPASA